MCTLLSCLLEPTSAWLNCFFFTLGEGKQFDFYTKHTCTFMISHLCTKVRSRKYEGHDNSQVVRHSTILLYMTVWCPPSHPWDMNVTAPSGTLAIRNLAELWCLYLDLVWALATKFVGCSLRSWKWCMMTAYTWKSAPKSFGRVSHSFSNFIRSWMWTYCSVNCLIVSILGTLPREGSEFAPSWYYSLADVNTHSKTYQCSFYHLSIPHPPSGSSILVVLFSLPIEELALRSGLISMSPAITNGTVTRIGVLTACITECQGVLLSGRCK